MTHPDPRTEYTLNLRALATLLDAHPDIPVPYVLSSRNGLGWYVHDSIETVLAIRELMDDALTLPHDSRDFPVEVTGTLVGFAATVDVARGIALDDTVPTVSAPMNPRLLAEPVPA